MSVIDRAFAKAYTRRQQPPAEVPASGSLATAAAPASSAATAPAAAPAPGPQPSDLEVHPGDCAVLWSDPALDQQLRSDGAHPSVAAPQAPALQPPAAAAPCPAPASPAHHESFDLQLLCQSQLAYAAPLEPLVDITAAPLPPTLPSPAVAPTAPAASPEAVAPRAASPEAAAPRTAAAFPRTAPPRVEQLRSEIALTPFAAGWEVDALEFPQCVRTLFAEPALRDSIGLPLDRAVGEGLQTLLLTSERARAGRTTVASGIAISAATAGLRVALVDANTASPHRGASLLADVLNLQVQQGWLDAIRRGEPVSEAAVHSIEDQLTILPQVPLASGDGAGGAGATAAEFAFLIQSLRPAFDLIVIDGPGCHEPAFESLGAMAGGPIDAVILVQDMRAPAPATAARVMQTLANRGVTGLGLVQNFS